MVAAPYAALEHACWVGGYDLGEDLTSMGLEMSVDPLDNTRFRTGLVGRSRQGGLRDVKANVDGYSQYGAGLVDDEIWSRLGSTVLPVTQSPTGAAGSVAYMHQSTGFSMSTFGEIGQLIPFSLGMQGVSGNGGLSVGAVRGQVAAAKQDVSATGVLGSVLELGAPTSTQYVYCVVHVFSAGTTITLQLQSDTAANFPSATTQATIGPLTAAGGTWMSRVAGPLAGETHWRLNVSAITGTFRVAAAIAVQ